MSRVRRSFARRPPARLVLLAVAFVLIFVIVFKQSWPHARIQPSPSKLTRSAAGALNVVTKAAPGASGGGTATVTSGTGGSKAETYTVSLTTDTGGKEIGCAASNVLTDPAPGARFLLYAPQFGLGNQLVALRNAAVWALILNRTLVLPHLLGHATAMPRVAHGLAFNLEGVSQVCATTLLLPSYYPGVLPYVIPHNSGVWCNHRVAAL